MSPPREPAVRAVEFERREVYRSLRSPGYTSWVSFFPGDRGQWYLTCEEVTLPENPLPQCTRRQWYEMGMPVGYDKSQFQMEIVLLESSDGLNSWRVVSRQPCRFHHSAGSFGQARVKDGRFLRFVWSCYSLDPSIRPNEILYQSNDGGRTWVKMPPFHDPHFASYPHRLRALRDGTLVLCICMTPRWGCGCELPMRTAMNLNAVNEMQMTLFFSHDQGRTWDGPLPIYGGQNVSETDFVELPNGHLLFVNSCIFAHPGFQTVYRDGRRFTPGPLEKVRAGRAPETICLTDEGILVGCMRGGAYYWSDDLGETWQPLEGVPDTGMEMYQPWIQYLADGRIACAGHYGLDDPIRNREWDQYVSLHVFRLEVLRKTEGTHIDVERDFDDASNRWLNAFTIKLTCDGRPLADKYLTFWYVEYDRPGYDSWNSVPLEERMRQGGTLLRLRTDGDGVARVCLGHLDGIEDVGHSYQCVAVFNPDRSDPRYKPAQTPQFHFYARSHPDPAL